MTAWWPIVFNDRNAYGSKRAAIRLGNGLVVTVYNDPEGMDAPYVVFEAKPGKGGYAHHCDSPLELRCLLHTIEQRDPSFLIRDPDDYDLVRHNDQPNIPRKEADEWLATLQST